MPAKRPASPIGRTASSVIPTRPASGTGAGAWKQAALGGHILRVACGICRRIGPMAEADFCADCDLLVQSECFGDFCNACCRPRCALHGARGRFGLCRLP